MEKAKKMPEKRAIVFSAAVYISFALAYSYVARGTVATFGSPVISNIFVAALVGGIVPFVLFEIGLRLFARPIERLVTGMDKITERLKIFFVCGNLATFLLSFIYYSHPFLSIWGGVLTNFICLLAALTVFLALEYRRMTDKSRAAYLIMQAGMIFLMLFVGSTVLFGLLGSL